MAARPRRPTGGGGAYLNSTTGGICFNTGAALHVQNSLIKNVRLVSRRFSSLRRLHELAAQGVVDAFLDQAQALVDVLYLLVALVFHPALGLGLFGRHRILWRRRRGC